MARIRVFTEDKPEEMDVPSPIYVRKCGLTKNYPFCDGSHGKTTDEDPEKVYDYSSGERKEA